MSAPILGELTLVIVEINLDIVVTQHSRILFVTHVPVQNRYLGWKVAQALKVIWWPGYLPSCGSLKGRLAAGPLAVSGSQFIW
jgi:hypothetical protein